MTDETLKVKVQLDTSDAQKQINNLKNSANNATSKTNSVLKDTDAQIQNIANSIKGKLNPTALNIAAGLNIKKNLINPAIDGIKSLKSEMSKLKNSTKDVGFSAEQRESINKSMWELKTVSNHMQKMAREGIDITPYQRTIKKLMELRVGFKMTGTTMKNNFVKQLSTVKEKLSQTFSNAKNYFGQFKNMLSKDFPYISKVASMAMTAIEAVVITKLVNMATGVAEFGDEIDKQSQRLGMSRQSYQEWDYIMSQNGVSISSMNTAMKQMTACMSDLAEGGDRGKETLGKLGITLDDLNNLSQEQIFEKVVVSLQGMEEGYEKARLAQQLFGRQGQEMLPMLNTSKGTLEELKNRAHSLGFIMSGESVAAAVAAGDSLDTMKKSVKGAANSLGLILLPVLQSVARWVTIAAAYINAFLKGIRGIKDQTDYSSKGLNSGSNALNGYSKNLKKATDAAKELRKQTMGFDEMNIMQPQSTSSGSDSGSGGGDSGDIDTGIASIGGLDGFEFISQEQLDKIDAFREKMEELGPKLGAPLAAIMRIGGVLLLVCGLLGLNLPMILAGIAITALGFGLGDTSFDALDEQLGVTQGTCEGIVDSLMVLVGVLLMIVGVLTTNIKCIVSGATLAAVGAGLGSSSGGFDALDEQLGVTQGTCEKVAQGILILVGVLLVVVGALTKNVKMIISGVALGISGIAVGTSSDDWGALGSNIIKFKDEVLAITATIMIFVGLILTIVGFLTTNIMMMGTGVALFIGGLTLGSSGAFDAINKKFDGLADKVSGISTVLMILIGLILAIVGFFTVNIPLIGTGIILIGSGIAVGTMGGGFDAIGKKIKEIVTNIKNDIKNAWDTVVGWFKNLPANASNFAKKVGDGIKGGIKWGINGVIGFFESAINWIIEKLNKLKFDVPDWVPGIGGKSLGFNLKEIKIKRLATGGIATRSTIANIGEDGKEAVLPLEKNTQWMDTFADKVAARQSGPTKLILNIDGRELGYATINNINKITKQTGSLQLQLI